MVSLGDKVKDSVSGFVGIAVARHVYLNGCARISIQPEKNKDGTLPQTETFDEPQLVVKTKQKIPIGRRATGGPEKFMPKPKTCG